MAQKQIQDQNLQHGDDAVIEQPPQGQLHIAKVIFGKIPRGNARGFDGHRADQMRRKGRHRNTAQKRRAGKEPAEHTRHKPRRSRAQGGALIDITKL